MPGYAAIEVAGLEKTFRGPRHQVNTLKERALHPRRRTPQEEHHVLREISFDVQAGEFFGVVGRNGSGKSTLLKCLAGIYRADAGHIRVAGQLAPFIELGIGFNPNLTARENVIINAVMMGLTPREARRRFDSIIDFAELADFLELKLKNYSSGMQVRLAFAVMVQADTDILLIDEVLAVGDAAFQQKCLDVFYRLRDRGKTIVLVTHDMGTVERFCHRALLLDAGRIALGGDPGEVGRRYLELNFEGDGGLRPSTRGRGTPSADSKPVPSKRAWVVEVWAESEQGERVHSFGGGERIHLHAVVEAREAVEQPHIVVWIDSPDWTRVFGAGGGAALGGPLRPGERVHVHVSVANQLAPNRYLVGCSITAASAHQDILDWRANAADFVIYSSGEFHGLVALEHEVELERVPTASPPGAGTASPRAAASGSRP